MDYLARPCKKCEKPMNGGVYRSPHICPHCYHEHPAWRKSRARRASAPLAQTAVHAEPEATQDVAAPAAEMTASHAASPAATDYAAQHEMAAQSAADAAAAASMEADESVAQSDTQSDTEAHHAHTGRIEPHVESLVQPVKAPRQPAQSAGKILLTDKSLTDYHILERFEESESDCTVPVPLTPEMFTGRKFTGSKHEAVVSALGEAKKQVMIDLRNQAQASGANLVAEITIKKAMKVVGGETAMLTVKASGVMALTGPEEFAAQA